VSDERSIGGEKGVDVYSSCDRDVQVRWNGREPRCKLFSLARSRWLGISSSSLLLQSRVGWTAVIEVLLLLAEDADLND